MRKVTTCLILNAVYEETRVFSLSSLELVVFRGKNIPGPRFGREGVDNGED